MIVRRLSFEEFSELAENAHKIVFHEERPAWFSRYDFVLIAEGPDGTPLGYVGCKEIDAGTVWLHHGGSFPSSQGISTAKGFHAFVNYLRERYSDAKLDTRNDNLRMIKLAYSAGFVIKGVEDQYGDLYLNMWANLVCKTDL